MELHDHIIKIIIVPYDTWVKYRTWISPVIKWHLWFKTNTEKYHQNQYQKNEHIHHGLKLSTISICSKKIVTKTNKILSIHISGWITWQNHLSNRADIIKYSSNNVRGIWNDWENNNYIIKYRYRIQEQDKLLPCPGRTNFGESLRTRKPELRFPKHICFSCIFHSNENNSLQP